MERKVNKMNIVKFELKRQFKSFLILGLVSFSLIFLFMAMFPSMESSGIQDIVGSKLGSFPDGLLEAFGLDDMVDFTDIMQYLAYTIQYFSMGMGIYGLILGIGSLLGEESRGTIEFLYGQPISRKEIVSGKLISSLMLIFISIAIVFAVTLISAFIYKPESYTYGKLSYHVIEVFLGMTFMTLVYFSIGLLLSVNLNPSTSFASVGIGIFFVTYILGVISKLKPSLEWMKFLSPFDYTLPMDIVRNGFQLKYMLAGGLIILVCIVFAYILYDKKDMKI